MFDIVYARKPYREDVEEIILVRRKLVRREDLEQVPKVIAPSNVSWAGQDIVVGTSNARVERDPFDVVKQDQARSDQQFSKVLDIDPVLLVSLEIDPRVLQQLDGVRRVHVVTRISVCAPAPHTLSLRCSCPETRP